MSYDTWFDSAENRTLIAICTRRQIKGIGIGGIIWGIINIGIGVFAVQMAAVNVGILILGVIMLGVGVQALRKPTLKTLLIESIVAGLLFAWNLGMTIYNMNLGEGFDPRGLIFPLVIAIAIFNQHKKLQHLREAIDSVQPAQIDTMKKTCKALLKKKLKNEPAVLQTNDAKTRVQLLPDRAFFAQRDQMKAFIVPRDILASALGDVTVKKFKLVVNHPLEKLTYKFDAKNSDKIRQWLATPVA